ncbi:alpha/beta-hydrolase [Aspergillus sclerotiicarbonarius CBS 121057]|uniref:Alpha/beta-hydrolase n=1 Tax=Aspergillus sclerotiicarbonarius (strain CBS 121057 / IBT 28362) TaxID=1448318 RepID=A0A319EWX7_ASPSB|nr:alpha/beta-hydrolase [Aspergillus sclerotiicarbonarius CBS 121057]
MSSCCLKGFRWTGTPTGQETTLAGINTYQTGTNPQIAILIIHDLYGWKFNNTRILADQLAEEVGATVYVPDFFGGESLPLEILQDEKRWAEVDIPGFMSKNTKTIREPEIFACARSLRFEHKYGSIGALGFCFGGWGVFRLGAKDVALVDCISTAHPTFLEETEIREVGVPVQILAPEYDEQFTEELKTLCNAVIPGLGVGYDYQFFPGLRHGFATRGDDREEGERAGMERAKEVVVLWFKLWLRE